MVMNTDESDWKCIDTLRTLSIDMVQRAHSGHPGTPLGAAPTAYCLWQRFLRYDPFDPDWPNRDRFVLSAGHACPLLYSLLYLCQIKAGAPTSINKERRAVEMEDLLNFRQMGSRCTGHPEYGWTAGVETTTGPLGQGAATSVGMAIAQRWLAETYNRPSYDLFDHNIYALCSDGDMMEGIASEAASLAGHLKLSNLCWVYDSNHITIEGSTALAFTEDVALRFAAYGWNVKELRDANDLGKLTEAYQAFLDTQDRPTLIIVQSHIGYGSPNRQDTREAHGEPLGANEVRLTKQFLGCDPDAAFNIPDGVKEHFAAQFGQRGKQAHAGWMQMFTDYKARYPDLAGQIEHILQRKVPQDWQTGLAVFPADAKGLSTRDSSGKVLNAIAARIPWLMGGAADLSPSTKTDLESSRPNGFQHPGGAQGSTYRGRNLHFGLREHAMCAVGNGMSLSGLRPYVSSFLIFTDYGRAALRLGAMMRLPVIGIWTHDSIGLGEDGPTHQPIEQLASFRAMPGMLVMRPGDANEVVQAWKVIMQLNDAPVCLVLSRQATPTVDRSKYGSAEGLAQGAYIVADADRGEPDVILLTSGTELALCIEAYELLAAQGVKARVVSMPCWELFETQSRSYRDSVLPPRIRARVAVEQASAFGWERYTGIEGSILGMQSFGMSAPGKSVERHFGFEPQHIVQTAKEQIEHQRLNSQLDKGA